MGTGPNAERQPVLPVPCAFPTCEADAAGDAPMCAGHQRVTVSQTGSWLEAG